MLSVVGQLISFIITLALGAVFMSMVLVNDFVASFDNDFGKDIVVPANLETQTVADCEEDDQLNVLPISPESYDVQLCTHIQRGLYAVALKFSPPEAEGTMFIRAFEETQNKPLSWESIEGDTSIHTSELRKEGDDLIYQAEFTIYEGGWEYTFPTRVEVHYSPENENSHDDQSRIIAQDVFTTYGWER